MPRPLIKNKVAESGLITIDLGDYLKGDEPVEIDLKDFLYKGLVLKEKDFRKHVKNLQTEPYRDKLTGIYCSSKAIVPHWAYMLMAGKLNGIAREIVIGSRELLFDRWLKSRIGRIDAKSLRGARVILKGCGEEAIGAAAYAYATMHLQPYVQSIMYGEACSTVPVYKEKKTADHE